MARFAPVVPIHIAKALMATPSGDDFFGGYHLLLAHDVLEHQDSYRTVYSEVRSKHGEDTFIIMDNSIVELGSAVSAQTLLDAAEIVQADCIVIPDVMGDGQGTRERAQEFVEEVRELLAGDEGFVRTPRLMGVVQGRSIADCMNTVEVFTELEVPYLAIPRVYQQMNGSRMEVTCMAADLHGFFNKIHLLGFSDNLLDDVACARLPFVSGIDSAVPVRAGMKGKLLDLNDPRRDFGKRGTYWSDPFPPYASREWYRVLENLSLIREWINIERFREEDGDASTVQETAAGA